MVYVSSLEITFLTPAETKCQKNSRTSSDVRAIIPAVFESVWVGILHLTNASKSLVLDGWKIVGGTGDLHPRKVTVTSMLIHLPSREPT